jgi:hypothetical protein
MDNVDQDKTVPETKPAGTTPGRPEPSSNKFAIARMANKQRKKRAHRRTLRRSNTKG